MLGSDNMFTLDEIKNIRKTYMYYDDTKELKLQMRVRNDSTVTKPEDLSQDEKNKIIAALYVSRSIGDAMSHYFNRGKSEQELLDEIQLGFDKQLLEPGEKSIRPMILITGRIADSMLVDLASPKENTNHMPEVYLQHLLSENGKKATNIRREIRGGQEYSISYDVEPLARSKNPFVASLNPNNSQYTQSTTEVELPADVAAKKRAFVDRLITYYDMMEHDDWYEKRLANEDKNMQKVANIVNHNGQVAPVENIGSLVRMLKAAKNLSIDGEKDYLEAIISQPEVHKALVAAKQGKKYDKIKEEALRYEQEGKVTAQGLREGHVESTGEKELRAANILVRHNPDVVAEARATLASKSHISFGTTTDDIKLSNLYCLVARTQGRIPSKQRTYDTIEFDSGTEQRR